MKKIWMFVFLVVLFMVAVIYVLGIKPFSNINGKTEEDFIRFYDKLTQITMEIQDNTIITKETYDKSSENECIIFENLHYQFIRKSYGNVFFCKDYDGMTGIGLLYSEYDFRPNPKQKVIKKLDERWLIIEEHGL